MIDTLKTCTKCSEELAASEFVRDRRRPDGLGSWCRGCMAAKVSAGKRGELEPRYDSEPWHRGCARCGEAVRNQYRGPKCRHPGAVQGVLELDRGDLCWFIPEGHPRYPGGQPG